MTGRSANRSSKQTAMLDRLRRVPRLVDGGFAVLAALAVLALLPGAARADACTPPVTSSVACENLQPGADPLDWQVDNNGDVTAIAGFSTAMSVNAGGTISFKVKSTSPAYHLDIYRLGYYQGLGARLMAGNITPTNTAAQPACQTFTDTGLLDCGNWNVSTSWNVPSTAVSGVYVVNFVLNNHVRGTDTGISQNVFVVRNDTSHSDIVYQTSDETWQAYNQYPSTVANSLYTCSICPPGNPLAYQGAFKVSYNRPMTTERDSPGSSLFNGAEYPMIRFLEQNGYDVSYFSGVDTNSRGSLIQNHKLFISNGHDEYWSAAARANVEAARAAGVNLAFFSGNEMFWRTRYEPSQAGPATDDRTLVAYKDTHFNAPTDPVTWTGTWRDRRFSSVNLPENALTGQSFVVNAGTSRITVPYAYHALRLWRNTAVANLAPGGTVQLAPSSLGYEWDVDADNGFRPAGSFETSSTTVSAVDAFSDYGSTLQANSTVTHNMTEYRAPSGALVFGAGTVQWAWGLSDWGNRTPDVNMEQATVNLFADDGAQPSSLVPGLTKATPSSDTTPPTSTVTTAPATVADGAKVTLGGTATDASAGAVAGVEVSTDGGSTWHPATGTTSWTYTWTAHGAPSTTIKTRAVDDSGNLETPGTGATVAVNCPCTMFATSTPTQVDGGDNQSVEVGVKFQSDTYGSVTGLRFYKASTNTGTHTGSLWAPDGTRLAQATFTGETASGWQNVTFQNPVAVLPNTTYIASYHAPVGHYSATSDYFWRQPAPGPSGGSQADSPPLHALRTTAGNGNGVYAYGPASVFPSNTSPNSANYWVDVMLTRTPAPGTVTNVSATSGGLTSANLTWSPPATGGAPTSYKITPYIGTAPQTPTSITGTPPLASATVSGLTNGTTYTFTVQALNPNGAGAESGPSNAVTPLTPVAPSTPQNVTVQPASLSARVNWSAPATDGDSPINGYTVTPYIGSTAQTPVQVGASTTTTTVAGLTNGVSYTFKVAATNAVGAGTAGTSAAVSPQATVFDFATPSIVDSADPDPVELGMKFKADVNGSVTGIRFYKAAANVGPHVGNLWSATGTRLAQATFANETASGWQSVTFSSPVSVTAGTTYIASYFTPSGHYSVTASGMTSGFDNPPLHALADGTSPNGVFTYGTSSAFPASTYHAGNYYVDVLYSLPKPGLATGVTATAARGSATVSWTAPASGGPVQRAIITPYIGSTAQATTTVNASGTSATVNGLTAGTAYTFTVQLANDSGPGAASAQSNSVTPLAPVAPSAPTDVRATPATRSVRVTWADPVNDSGRDITGHTVIPYIGSVAQSPVQVDASATSATVTGLANGTDYTFTVTRTNSVGTSAESAGSNTATPDPTIFDFGTPAVVDGGDASPVEVGVKFRADVGGTVTGVRFYKAAANTGTHIGNVWSSSGGNLATATFTGESASGWQTVTFANPVRITPGTTYVASYYAPSGHYSYTGGGLSAGADNGVLHAIADSTSANGVYAYSGASTFPVSSFNAADYGVDVLFAPTAAPGAVTGVAAAAGGRSATVTWNAPAGGGTPTSYKITPYIGSTAQAATTTPAPATSLTLTGLTPGTSYTFTVQAIGDGGAGPESGQSNPVTPTAATLPAAPTGVAAEPATSSAQVRWTAPPESGSAITGYTITPYAGSTAQAPTQAGGSATSAVVTGLTNGTDYTFKVHATNGVGAGADSTASAPVTPRATLLDFGTPATVDGGDSGGIAIGVKFTADLSGSATGLRFYKAATNTGTHVGTLYTAGGSVLGQATFTGESTSGWQSVTFTTPVPLVAGTTYVASYFAPNGHYSVTGAAFSAGPLDNPPLHALSDLVTPNGVYSYTGTPAFPTSNFNATNYWVDVLFAPAP